jgi:hypothetical protein
VDWTPVLTTAVGALAAGGAALLTGFQANRQATRTATLQSKTEAERRLFEAGERRYDHRREAVVEMDEAATGLARQASDFWRENFVHIGDVIEESLAGRMDSALARVAMLTSPPVEEAARGLYQATLDLCHEGKGSWADFDAARSAFRVAGRGALAEPSQGQPHQLTQTD